MKRKEYMEELEQLLLSLPTEEREEALRYYNDYFEDAGVENEDRVIRELGTPEEVSAKIKAGDSGEYAEYSEQGFEDSRFFQTQEITVDRQEEKENFKKNGQKKIRDKNINVWKILAILLLVFLAAPVILPLGVAAILVLIAVLIAIAAVLFGIGISGIAILAAGIAVIAVGIAKMAFYPATGILAAGVGCLLLAAGILLTWGIVSVMVKIVPGCIRFIVRILGTPFRRAGVGK